VTAMLLVVGMNVGADPATGALDSFWAGLVSVTATYVFLLFTIALPRMSGVRFDQPCSPGSGWNQRDRRSTTATWLWLLTGGVGLGRPHVLTQSQWPVLAKR